MENYVERLRGRVGGEETMAASYRVELVRQEFIAEKIVRHFRSAPRGSKLVVFLAASDLRASDGVPFYVAQKTKARQLVLAADSAGNEQPRLLTAR